MEKPDRVLIGGRETPSGQKAVQTIVDIYAHWVPRERIVTTIYGPASYPSWRQCFSGAAHLLDQCHFRPLRKDRSGCHRSGACRGDGQPHGGRFLRASIGFGGSCLQKRYHEPGYLCHYYHLDEVADYWDRLLRMNDNQQARFVSNIVSAMFNTIAGKRIALFGAAFKANTSDTRDSPRPGSMPRPLAEHAAIVITDPHALENARIDLGETAQQVIFEPDALRCRPRSACSGNTDRMAAICRPGLPRQSINP